jgi:DNA helicase-2/ATP-dependent DNA helicase PcrA
VGLTDDFFSADGSLPDLLGGLNPAQAEAVAHEDGPLLVVAGAGSGKTRVLTRRVAYLMARGRVSPFQILAITFTNKAADEMKSRVAALVGPVAHRMWVSTFHSACVRILRREAHRLGYRSSFSIYDQADSQRLVQYVMGELGMDTRRTSPRSVQAAISAAKNELVGPEAFRAGAGSAFESKVADVYAEYQRRLVAANAMDFDDLLSVTVELLSGDPAVLAHYQQRFAHILVDEYQDTNRAQNELVVLLGSAHGNVCVVGDSDQSIYRFRGAEVRNILEFESAFPDARVVVLEQNYRSTQNILDAANAVISCNPSRHPKVLWSAAGPGEQIVRYQAADEADEAAWVCSEIARLTGEQGVAPGQVAVFYRTNAQSRALEEELVRRQVPYQVVGGTRFYDRREVRDVLAYLRVLHNPADELSLRRVVNLPRRGVGDQTMAKLAAWATGRSLPLAAALPRAEEAGVSGRAAGGLRRFACLLEELGALAASAPPARLVEEVLERTGYRQGLEAEQTVEAEGRLENLAELVGVAAEYEDLGSFLEDVALVSDADELESDTSRVALMTLHAAKGLEFEVVFLVGMEEGIFPHLHSLGDPAQLEEERRLCYVGLTRARHRLYLTHAWRRFLFGATQYNPPSRFLSEIPPELVRSLEAPAGEPAYGQTWSPGGLAAALAPGPGPARRPVRGRGAERLGLQVGDDVVHSKWGEGVVVALRGEGEDAEATVRFAGVGDKQLALAWAPLKRA